MLAKRRRSARRASTATEPFESNDVDDYGDKDWEGDALSLVVVWLLKRMADYQIQIAVMIVVYDY